jgi:hypothetical protein
MQFTNLPQDLPVSVPKDDGISDHLLGMSWPSVNLCSTNDQVVDL